MSLNYGNDVRVSDSTTTTRSKGRVLTSYFFVYGEQAELLMTYPKTIPGYPDEVITERLDDESYILLRTLLTDNEVFDTSGVVFDISLWTHSLDSGGAAIYRVIDRFSLDDLVLIYDRAGAPFLGKTWRLGSKRYMLKDVLSGIDLSNFSHMYVTLRLREKDLTTTIGNEWGLSVLLNSPAPTY